MGYFDRCVFKQIALNFYMAEYVVIVVLVIKKKVYCCLFPVAVKPEFMGSELLWSCR
jgi:hypothetical protein